MADRLLADMHVDHAQIAAVLSQHLMARIEALEEGLDQITAHFPAATRAMTLRLIQLAPTDPDELQQDPPDDFWTRPLPVTQLVLDEWKIKASQIHEIRAAHSALRKFALIEEYLSELEQPITRFMEEIDSAIQMEIDESRRK